MNSRWSFVNSPYFAFFVSFLSLAFLRHQIVANLGMDYGTAMDPENGKVFLGFWYDACVLLLPWALANLVAGPLRLPKFAIWLPLALMTWAAALANTIYLRFFGQRLDFWIVKLHWSDIFVVGDEAGSFGATWPVTFSVICFVAGAVLMFRHFRASARKEASKFEGPRFSKTWIRSRLRPAGVGVAMVVAFLMARQSPVWFNIVDISAQSLGNLLTQQILVVWYDEVYSKKSFQGRRMVGATAGMATEDEFVKTMDVLAAYRDYTETRTLKPESLPVYRDNQVDPALTAQLREKFGFAKDGKLNVILLFLESVRGYEFQHPEMGPRIFPRLRKLMDQHAVQFTRAYTSSFNAGQTVRGQFMTLCSMLDNMVGPAAYIYYNTVSVRCIQQYLKDHGYTTAWFNSYERNFHNKYLFESLHGMDRFYDGDYFVSKGITEKFHKWGYADKPVLQESLRKIEEISKEGKPFFAHILTITTHHPYSVIPGGELPADVAEWTKNHKGYQGYLSRLKYTDDSVSDFIEKFLASPLAENTVLFLQSDHGTPDPLPHYPLTTVQRDEMEFRIPMAIFAKNLRKPEKVNYPVHQVDVAPTMAQLTGLSGPVTWLGRGLFSGEGRPWLFLREEHLSYRTRSRGCYSDKHRALTCYDFTDGSDPMYSAKSKPTQEDPLQTAFFKRVALGTSQAIEMNLFARRELDLRHASAKTPAPEPKAAQ